MSVIQLTSIVTAAVSLIGLIIVAINSHINSKVIDALQNNHLAHLEADVKDVKEMVKIMADSQTECKANVSTLFRQYEGRISALEARDVD